MIFVGLHFGAIELPRCSSRRGSAAPWPRWRRSRTRRSRTGSSGPVARPGSGSSGCARPAASCWPRSATGRPVGLVGDRDLTGGGLPVTLFGAPANLPLGRRCWPSKAAPRCLSPASGATGIGRYRGRLEPVAVPVGRLTPRARDRGDDRARGRLRAGRGPAPEQWWAVFFPIWPDLEAGVAGAGAGGRDVTTTDRRGRADLHIHTVASDGTATVERRCTTTSSWPAGPRTPSSSGSGW